MAVGIFVEPIDWIMTAVEIYRDPTNPLSYVGLIPGIPAGAGKLVKRSFNIATDVLRNLPHGKILKMGDKFKGMDHILRRHAFGMPDPMAGKFNNGWHMTQISDAIHAALARANGVPTSSSAGKDVFDVVLDDVVGKGVDQASGIVSDTRKIRVVVSQSTDEIITAFPIPE